MAEDKGRNGDRAMSDTGLGAGLQYQKAHHGPSCGSHKKRQIGARRKGGGGRKTARTVREDALAMKRSKKPDRRA